MTLRENIQKALKNYFNFDSFRPNQAEAITAILEGKDLFAVMPTSAGKSLCYQLPAILLPGITIVVSPLIALMADQVEAAKKRGIPADFLSKDERSDEERKRIFSDLFNGKTKLLYLSPERLNTPSFWNFLRELNISLFALDEAHCVTEWGNSFRQDYLMLSEIRKHYPSTPIAAFTATATTQTQQALIKAIGLKKPLQIRASFNRPELEYHISPKTKLQEQILKSIQEYPKQKGIVYRLSRDNVEKTAEFLIKNGIKAAPYHARLSAKTKTKNQQDFSRGKIDVIVATIAFGMGIDTPDIRYVIHGDLPSSMEAYYQETGRAGRDGKPSTCILFYNKNDSNRRAQMIINNPESESDFKKSELAKLNSLSAFAGLNNCRRKALLAYFGEETKENCGNCDVCKGLVKTVSVEAQARILISTINQLKGSRNINYGATYYIDFITGNYSENIGRRGHSHLSTFGIGKNLSKNFWRSLITQLLEEGLIEESADKYRTLDISYDGADFMRHGGDIQMVATKELTSK